MRKQIPKKNDFSDKSSHNILYSQIKKAIESARTHAVQAVNSVMIRTYFDIGCMLVEHLQKGEIRAGYADKTVELVANRLTLDFGRGFTKRNLELMRQFYLMYGKTKSVISQSMVLSELTWTHFIRLMRVDSQQERKFYEIEAVKCRWSVRELDRQINTALYERLVLSRDKKAVKLLSVKGQEIDSPRDVIKDPYVLEFLGLPEHASFSESDLESAIINKLEAFLLELGKGFLFVGRQVRLTLDDEHYFVDLVFYNRHLKSFVLIDLKIGKLTHQNLGQMQMYVNYYDRCVKSIDENNTIGIVLCRDKKDSLVEMTLPEGNRQIFASKYRLYLPSKEELYRLMD